ncbi:threonine transporter [Mycolicibacterium cosmeticum]|uniref:RhtB family protein transporter n=1 Tax=Mycolicibacterium cosmeticum TaxID=258533 RepID=W9AUS8_MYCCO|nr:LysE family transporter [Mycolicibacterium cosmeticum]TLH71277.1 threonine transporter [Mycolicibacterium cosmeticum]CDO06356.1 RhtB family protein transporter [Mycolicibacterium cosmeticum]
MNADVLSLLTIAGAIAIGAMSPGPSFVMVAQTALSTTPRNGRVAAAGMGCGGLIFATAATTGLGAALIYAGPLFLALKIAGGIYLIYLGIRLWRSANRESTTLQMQGDATRRTFVTALLTQLSNPKAIVVYGSVFATALPLHPASWLLIALPITVTAVEVCWYLIVATVMSRPGPRRAYLRGAKSIDRLAGAAMGGLGAFFAIDGVRRAIQ